MRGTFNPTTKLPKRLDAQQADLIAFTSKSWSPAVLTARARTTSNLSAKRTLSRSDRDEAEVAGSRGRTLDRVAALSGAGGSAAGHGRRSLAGDQWPYRCRSGGGRFGLEPSCLGWKVRDGRLWGRGSCDMKGGVASGVFAVQALVDAGCRARRRPLAACRLRRGSGWLEHATSGRSDLPKVDAVIVAEPTELQISRSRAVWCICASRSTGAKATPGIGTSRSMPERSATKAVSTPSRRDC